VKAQNRVWDPRALREELSTPFWRREPAPLDEVRLACEEARALGEAAIGGDREARKTVEHFLYTIHLHNAASTPCETVPGLVWSTLMQLKMREADRLYGGHPLVGSDDELRARAQALVEERTPANHPFFDALDKEGPDLRGFKTLQKNIIGASMLGYEAQLCALLKRTTGAARKAVLANLNDELSGDTHFAVRTTFYTFLGLKYAPERATEDPDCMLEALEVASLRTCLTLLGDPWRALGSFFSIESSFSLECKRHARNLRNRSLPEAAIHHITSHADLDDDHGREWLDSAIATEPNAQQRALFLDGARMQMSVRWLMYDAIKAHVFV
jgi:heme oxygenase-like protein